MNLLATPSDILCVQFWTIRSVVLEFDDLDFDIVYKPDNMANKGGNITTRQASKQSKKDGVSKSDEESILINEDDFEDAPAWGKKALANNMKELTKFTSMDETCAMITDYSGKIEAVSEKATTLSRPAAELQDSSLIT